MLVEVVWAFERRVFQLVNYLFFPVMPAELVAAEEIALLYTAFILGVLIACHKNSNRGCCFVRLQSVTCPVLGENYL